MLSREAMTLVSLMTVATLSSCGKKDLDCGSNEAKDLVVQIVKDSLLSPPVFKPTPGTEVFIKNGTYKLNTIRMTAKDSATGAVSCAANINIQIEYPNNPKAVEQKITYKLELTSDDELYGTVYGLWN